MFDWVLNILLEKIQQINNERNYMLSKLMTSLGKTKKGSAYYALLCVATKLLMLFVSLHSIYYNVNFTLHQFICTFYIYFLKSSAISIWEATDKKIISPMNPPISPNIWTSGYNSFSSMAIYTLGCWKDSKIWHLRNFLVFFRVSTHNKNYYPFPVLQY